MLRVEAGRPLWRMRPRSRCDEAALVCHTGARVGSEGGLHPSHVGAVDSISLLRFWPAHVRFG